MSVAQAADLIQEEFSPLVTGNLAVEQPRLRLTAGITTSEKATWRNRPSGKPAERVLTCHSMWDNRSMDGMSTSFGGECTLDH